MKPGEDTMKQQRYLSPASIISCLLIIVLTAGCGSGAEELTIVPPTIALPSVTPTLLPTETVIPTPPPAPTDTPKPFVPKATLKIFSISPLSGDQDVVGRDIGRAAQLAVNQLASPLMDLGYKVELVSYDDKNDPGIAVSRTKEIVADPDILCGVGPYSSRSLNQVKEIYHQAGLAFISPSMTAAYATATNYLEVNRVVGRHDGQGIAGAQFAKSQGFSRVFILSQSDNYAQFNSYHFQEEAERLGIEVVGNLTTDSEKKFAAFIERILESNADLVYFSTLSEKQAGSFFGDARAAGYTGAFLGNEGIASPGLLQFVGSLLLKGGGMYYTTMAAPASAYPGATKFLEDFKAFYKSVPQTFAAQAYDAAGVCMKAIEEASRANGGEIPTRAQVANAIRALQKYEGITGAYQFNQNGDPDPAQYFVFQVVSAEPMLWDRNKMIISFAIAPPP
jgi:ABC-type branched-subunit amino acid transport system substrate-binding protein